MTMAATTVARVARWHRAQYTPRMARLGVAVAPDVHAASVRLRDMVRATWPNDPSRPLVTITAGRIRLVARGEVPVSLARRDARRVDADVLTPRQWRAAVRAFFADACVAPHPWRAGRAGRDASGVWCEVAPCG